MTHEYSEEDRTLVLYYVWIYFRYIIFANIHYMYNSTLDTSVGTRVFNNSVANIYWALYCMK